MPKKALTPEQIELQQNLSYAALEELARHMARKIINDNPDLPSVLPQMIHQVGDLIVENLPE
jgi:hypothetical protein